MNRLLDVALAAYGIPEPRGMATWHAVFQQERQEQMARFQIMVANKKLLMQILGDEQQQLEVLTLLAYDFQKHGEDTYTDLEYDVISDVYQTCLRLSGLLVVAVPEWFVPAYEIQQSRWQGIGVDVEYLLNQNEEFCTRQASALWDLHHPHVVKLFGACHVGGFLFLVHESVKKSVSSRDAQLETAHILHITHGVPYIMKQLDNHDKPHWHFWNRKAHQLPQTGSGIVNYTQSYADPKLLCFPGTCSKEGKLINEQT
ncbi:hypothetical protein JG687_00018657 [Phytophthora cactorum]|uniref:Protein kinase-like domain n=1 Tax=Phytophthora cactorum TaxID=29920 RepID=A0A8T1TM63_9STRA|nr:hypothetical protein JG687_00018657 [Phytophthora cactorum]